jgi:hypothetical protein
MSEPFIFIGTRTIREDRLQDFSSRVESSWWRPTSPS